MNYYFQILKKISAVAQEGLSNKQWAKVKVSLVVKVQGII